LPIPEILHRVAAEFRHVVIDWDEGDRWVDNRISKSIEIGYAGFLLEAERALRGKSVLVLLADSSGPDVAWIGFYMTPDTGMIELHYSRSEDTEQCRVVALKLASQLGYRLVAD
jgi:hypothetical protein